MYEIFRIFFKEIKDAIRRFSIFIQSQKGIILVLFLEMFFLYGQTISYYDISIDSEKAILSLDNILTSWLTIDRYGLLITKKIFGLIPFVPQVSNFLMILTLAFSSLFFNFCIHEWIGKEKRYKLFYYVFPIAYVSAPCLAEQFHFSLQSFEVAWAGLLCMMSVYCICRYIIFQENIFWTAIGIALMIWAFGSYQAFVGFYITITLIAFLMCYLNPVIEYKKNLEWVFLGIKNLLIFIMGLLGYKIVGKLVKMYYHIDSSYIDNMYTWKTSGVSAALNNIKGDISRIYLAEWDVFFQKLFLPVLIICIMLLLFRGWIMHKNGYIMYIMGTILLAASPSFLTIVSGSYQPIRGQLVYPLVYAFCLAMLTTVNRKTISYICFIIALVVSLYQGQTMTQLFHTAHLTYEQDKALASSVYKDIEKVGVDAGLEKYTVVFVGKREVRLPEDAIRGEVIGHSFFVWDAEGYAGSTNRIVGLCKTLGYYLETPSEKQAEKAKQIAANMSVWPSSEGIRLIDDLIIIRLS